MAAAKRRKKRKIFSPVYLTLILIILYLPILMVVIYSFNSGRTIGSWQGFTTSWYSRLFSNALMADALKNSLILAAISSLLAGGIGTLGAIGLSRSHLKLGGAIESLATLPMMIPELVLGMAYLSVFTAVGVKLGMGALILTHTTFPPDRHGSVAVGSGTRFGRQPDAGAEGHHAAAGFPCRAVGHDALRRHEP